MANFNKVILSGNLTRDPQLSYTPGNTAVCEFGIAINRKWRTQDGQEREDVCFVDCTCFGKQAEVFDQYMSKGRPILLEGRLKFDTWENKEGQKRNKLSVVVESFQFLGGGDRDGDGDRDGERRESRRDSDRGSGRGGRSGSGNKRSNNDRGKRSTVPEEHDYDNGPGVGDDVPF